MTTIKEILTANRETVIASIKSICKVWKDEDVKAKMIDFLAYCNEFVSADELAASNRINADLKMYVQKMVIRNSKPQPKVKLAEMLSTLNDNKQFNHITKTYN